jgi:hypothetical protein
MNEHRDVEAHGMNLGNTNETVQSDDEVEAHSLVANTNETVESDHEVEAHALISHMNEIAVSDD